MSDLEFTPNFATLAQTTDTMFQGYLDPVQAKDYFAAAQRQSVIQRFATKIPMGATGVRIPHWTGNVSAQWVAEGEKKPITKGNMTKQDVVPHKIATIFVASAEVVRANPGDYLGHMRSDVAVAIAKAFDFAVLYGDNSPFARYMAQTSKVQPLGTNLYDSLAVQGLSQLVNDGKKWRQTILDDKVEPLLNGSKDDNGRPLFLESTYDEAPGAIREGRIVGRPTIILEEVARNNVYGFQGDFSQIVWGQVGGLSYSVSNQATLDLSPEQNGSGLTSLWQNNLVAVLVEAEYGVLINDPEAFAKLIVGDLHYQVTVNGSPTGGTYTLKVNGVPTAAIAFDANDAAIKAAIVAVDDGISASQVTVVGGLISAPATVSLDSDASLTGGTNPHVVVTDEDA